MIDTDAWQKIEEILSIAQQTRRPRGQPQDNIGELHLMLFGNSAAIYPNLVPPATM